MAAPVVGFKTFGTTSTSQNPTNVILGIAPTWLRFTVNGSQLSYGIATSVKQAALTPGQANSSQHCVLHAENGQVILAVKFHTFTANGAQFVVETANVNRPVLIEAGN